MMAEALHNIDREDIDAASTMHVIYRVEYH